MSTLLLVNIAIFIFSIPDFSETTQIRKSSGNNVSVFERMLQNRRFNNLLKNPLDLRKKAQKSFNKKRENRARHVGHPKRIAGGQLADISEFPYMASVVTADTDTEYPIAVMSTAVIISEKWVITHFSELSYRPNETVEKYIRILYHNPNQANHTKSVHKIKDIIEIFQLPDGYIRVVLIEVERPFKIRFYQVAYFATDFSYEINSYVKVLGWGKNYWDMYHMLQYDVDSLRYADTKLVPCDFKDIPVRNKHMFTCTVGGIACTEDTSAALVQNSLVIGILVHGTDCINVSNIASNNIYIKSKYLIKYISEYVYTHVDYY